MSLTTSPAAEPKSRFSELWRNSDFVKFWAGESISFVGSEVTHLALPLTAVLVLQAGPAQMGLLSAMGYVPFLLVGLMAGVWVDRFRRQPMLIATDLGNALLLGSIPVAALLGLLSIEQLYVVTLLVGILNVVSAVAYQSFVPSLVKREQLVEGNSKLEVSSSVAGIAGPGVGGLLVQGFTAPVAIVADAASFLASAVFLGFIRTPETPPAPHASRSVRADIVEGLHLVAKNPLLRSIVSCGAMHNFFSRMLEAVYVLYVVRELHLGPALLGTVLAMGGPGALLGALAASRTAQRFGVGPTIVAMQVLTGIARLFIPLATGPTIVVVIMLMLAEFLLGVARPIFNITQLSLRQGITPDRLQGRVNATMRFIMWGVTPFGALLGGLLAQVIGLRVTLFIAACGVLLAFAWVYVSPVRRLREQPTMPEDAATAVP